MKHYTKDEILHKLKETSRKVGPSFKAIEFEKLEIVNADRTLTMAAAHLKTKCPVAYADCFAAALSQVKNAALVTGGPEFRKIKPDLFSR